MNTALLPIVDEHDEIVGYKARNGILPTDIYRVAALWITNSQGDVLLARRAVTKQYSPGKWGPAVSGTVEKDETYDSNIIKEAAEELGLVGIGPVKSLRFRWAGERSYFVQWYTLTIDTTVDELQLQADEVAEAAWFTRLALEELMRDHPDDVTSSAIWAVEHL